MDTIFAVSSGRPPAGIAVIRISGDSALNAVRALAGDIPPPRVARVRSLRDATGALLDRALVLAFPGPGSATGEDLAELHCHGGRAVIDAVEGALGALPGLRHAAPGEFTRRALTNGRIDLAEAQGLADLLAAETERQRIAALDAAEGKVSRAVRGWLDRIAAMAAAIEAGLDFGDEDDVIAAGDPTAAVRAAMAELAGDIRLVIEAPPVERIRDGVWVVIGGPPNSGKSTLLNLLVDRDAAIVSPIAGTTRDRVDAPVSRDGIPYLITDTAGLTQTADVVEAIGVERATAAIAHADILLWLADTPPPRPAIWIHARADLPGRGTVPLQQDIAIAANDEGSIGRLWRMIGQRAESLIPTTDRLSIDRVQRIAAIDAVEALVVAEADSLIVAEQLRQASIALASILGMNATETMLDALFGRFCIGK